MRVKAFKKIAFIVFSAAAVFGFTSLGTELTSESSAFARPRLGSAELKREIKEGGREAERAGERLVVSP